MIKWNTTCRLENSIIKTKSQARKVVKVYEKCFTLAQHSALLYFFVAGNLVIFVSNPIKMNKKFYFTFKISFEIIYAILPCKNL